MKAIILGGFLGAGKTTVLMQLARYIVAHTASEKANKVVIIENEIGKVGVDDMLLKSNGYSVSELFAGCACCTMAGELRGTLRVMQKEMDPEWIIIEATGVAYPQGIVESIEPVVEGTPKICCLVDSQRLTRMLRAAPDLTTDQIKDAQTVLINKIDLVDAETLAKVDEAVAAINTAGKKYHICGLETVDEAIWAEFTGE